MTPEPAQPWTKARDRLRVTTRDAHEALHAHPLLASLQTPELTQAQLVAVASVSFQAVSIVEAARQRHDVWPELSLAAHLSALRRELPMHRQTPVAGAGPALRSASELLGALYVIHGSAFGSAVLYTAVKAVLPQAPKVFFLPKIPGAWQYLVGLLAALPPEELPDCEAGAVAMFDCYRRLADAHLQAERSLHPLQ